MRRSAILGWVVGVSLLCTLGALAQGTDSNPSGSANWSAVAPGTVPRLIKFTGVVHELASKVPSGSVTLTFSLYPLPEGGTTLWVETQSVPLDSLGGYTVLLGANSPGGLPLDLFTTGSALWLGVQPQWSGMSEQPRVLLVAVPYALKAADADTLGGKPASAYALSGAQTLVVPVTGAGSAPPASTPALTANPSGDRMAAAVQPATACTSVTADGNAVASQVALYSGACALTESTTLVDVSGKIGIGTASPSYPLDVQLTSTATSGSVVGHRLLATLNPAAASAAGTYGTYSLVQTASSNTQNFTGSLQGGAMLAYHYGTGTLSSVFGMNGSVVNLAAGTLTSAYGIYARVQNTSTGTVGAGYGIYVAPPVNSGGGKFTKFTGLYIGNPTAAATNYALYSAGGTNYFAGNVGIGTTTPGANLEVNGTAKFDSTATFSGATTFSGAATFNGAVTMASTETTTGSLSGSTASFSGNVSAATGTFSGSTSPVVSATNTANSSTAQLGTSITVSSINGSAQPTGIYGSGYYGVAGNSASGYGVVANGIIGVNGTGMSYGVLGQGTGNGSYGVYGSGTTYGVYGYSNSVWGELGTSVTVSSINPSAELTGVYGGGSASFYGVVGTSVSGTGGWGVVGSGDNGVYGSAGASGGSGVSGVSATGTGGWGVSAAGDNGVWASSGASNGWGVYGISSGSSGFGVYGEGPTYGVYAQGNLGASGTKPAVVALPDNRVVELYAMESPELWFEDFGSSQLRDGVAEVALDPTFALSVNTGTAYHVFLTPNGECEGLYVARKTATGFEVRELHSGKSGIEFDYRIVAKRRGYEDVRMDQLETDAETVQRIREVVQNRPAHRKLILHKPPEPPKAPAEPRKLAAAPAVVTPKPLEPPKLLAPPRPPEPPKMLVAPPPPKAVTPAAPAAAAAPKAAEPKTPAEPEKPPAPPEPPQK